MSYHPPFTNQYYDYDFTFIVDVIKKYFPVDEPERLTSESISSWPGFKELGKIINAEFMDKKSYRDKWGKLTSDPGPGVESETTLQTHH